MKRLLRFTQTKTCLLLLAISLLTIVICAGCSNVFVGDNHINDNNISLKSDLSKLELIDKSKLSIAIASDYPPFESFKSVQPVGLDVDISYQICHDLGLGIAFNNTEFSDVLNRVNDKKNDIAISGITITDERLTQYDFSIPYFQDTKCAVVRKDTLINESNIDSILTSSDKTIVVQTGSTSKDYVKKYYPNTKLVEKQTNEQCTQALENNEADIFIVEKSYYDNKLSTNYLNVKNFDWTEKFGIAISKDCPNLKAAIDEVIQARLSDGTIDTMIKEHFK